MSNPEYIVQDLQGSIWRDLEGPLDNLARAVTRAIETYEQRHPTRVLKQSVAYITPPRQPPVQEEYEKYSVYESSFGSLWFYTGEGGKPWIFLSHLHDPAPWFQPGERLPFQTPARPLTKRSS